ncbi:hypothetical protein [Mycetocola zhujimingii]|uniref:DUF2975 domain-containing protein n=1 Tax=Mycetocola zhujimingii TaxID=2079792 RepID=A0A2U1TFY3_9MICO|nr:hypothetical protein [Mycetocola zhujimingii]AWB87266.1 hypothetical protein C3E77_12020 [Mycetocola zhujimingii]PWC07776.1 hypothetical protein DF223_04810 [Mycetocola zhujimingii]
METEVTARPTRSDRADLWTVIVVGVMVAVFVLVNAIVRIASIVPNTDVDVLAPFFDTVTALPLGPDGAMVDVRVDSAWLTVSDLPVIVVVSLVAAVLVELAMTLVIVASAMLLCRNLMTGNAFSRTNTRLVFTVSIALIAGTTLSNLFTTMGTNGAFATLSQGSYDGAVATGNVIPYFAAIALAAVALAFKAGERLQRDAEGLI